MLVTEFCTEYVQRFQGLFNFFIYFSNKCLSNLRGCVFERDIFSKYNCPMYIIHKRTSNTMNHKESLIILMERPAENEFPEIILNLWEYLQSTGRRLQKCLEIGCWVSFFPPAMFSPTRRRLTLRRTNRERGAKSANRHLG